MKNFNRTLAAILLGLALGTIPPACTTTGGGGNGGGGVTDTLNKTAKCTISAVVDRAPTIYGKVSTILTSAKSYEEKKQDLLSLAISLGPDIGMQVVACVTRQYIVDIEEDTRAGAVDPATLKGASDGRQFLDEEEVKFEDPPPAARSVRRN